MKSPSGLHCPSCGSDLSTIVDTRKGENIKVRKRRCFKCREVYETIETIAKQTEKA